MGGVPMRVVHIEWIDSHTDTGWDAFTHTDAFDLCHTVGFILDETEHYIIVAHSFDPATDEWNGRISIPLCAVKNVRTLCRIKIL